MEFYFHLLRELVDAGKLDPHASTLVVAGAEFDRDALSSAGFTNATISNIRTKEAAGQVAPYAWQHLDAENLEVADESFDQVIEHMGLHHCGSPHRALLEMYRVARKAVLVVENRDSFLMHVANKLGFAGDFEFEAVMDGNYEYGGHRNTAVPNHVYRWTEREVEKTIASADPAYQVPIEFFHDLRFPEQRVAAMRGLKRAAAEASRLPLAVFAKLFPRQANVFGFLARKGERRLQPWMERDGGRMKQGEWR